MNINEEINTAESRLANKITEALLPLYGSVGVMSMREVILQAIREFFPENANQMHVVEYMERTPEGKISIRRHGYSEYPHWAQAAVERLHLGGSLDEPDSDMPNQVTQGRE